MRRFPVQILGLVLACVVSTPASAHVGSSDEVNNRYYKITPMADRVRVAYTIFFGREPGMQIRRRMDSDHDGRISASESGSYAEQIAVELRKSVAVELDGTQVDVRWRDIDIGMGTPSISGGPFSLDLVGSVCLASQQGQENRFVFRDQMRVPKPGETELFLDPAPGIRVTGSRIDGRDARSRGERWLGGPGPAQEGYQLAFVVESDETGGMDSLCDPPPPRSSRQRWWIMLGLGAGLVGTALFFWRRRRAAATPR